MTKPIYNLAFDFGASSGRLMLSTFSEGKLTLEEIHRFENAPVLLNGRLFWDFPRMFNEVITGLKKVGKMNIQPSGIAVDTWGVDYGLLDQEGHLISNPVCYRDTRTHISAKEVHDIIPFEEFYKRMGLQFMELNTVYQLYYDCTRRNDIIKSASALLFMPDLFGYFLSGSKYSEYTIASTSQLINGETRQWDTYVLDKLSIPESLLQPLVKPGTIVGTLRKELSKLTGLGEIPVIAVGGHDTASAVCASPLSTKNSAYLSCGTWSLLGIESDEPIINEDSYRYNFTNEGGVEGKIRFLKNITGLWILQQLKKKWSETMPDISYPYIISEARKELDCKYLIDPDDPRFVAPDNMIEEVKNYCLEHQGTAPETIGQIAMAAYNGITKKYHQEILGIEDVTGNEIDVLHMVGGGIQDTLLCELTAKTIKKDVIAGPIEASVTGNILMQLKALGHLGDLEECRNIVKDSFDMKTYLGRDEYVGN